MTVAPRALLLIAALTSSAWADETAKPLANGWTASGTLRAAEEYETGVDHATSHGGKSSAVMRSKVDKPADTIYLKQLISADDYRGKRVRLSGFAKSEGAGQFRLWLNALTESGAYLFGDAMRNRPLTGAAAWTRCEVVIDIPLEGARLSFGTAFFGKGAAWVDDLVLEVVDKSVPTTAAPPPRQPQNLGFEE